MYVYINIINEHYLLVVVVVLSPNLTTFLTIGDKFVVPLEMQNCGTYT